MAMDAACNVLYLDRSARQERMVRRGEAIAEEARAGDDAEANEGARRLQVNVLTLLETFSKVYVCPTGLSCLARIARLNNVPTAGLVPTLVLIDIPEDDDENERRRSLPWHDAGILPESSPPSIYGSQLLRQIVADVKEIGVASMVLPVAVIRRRIETPTSTPRPSTPIRTIQNTQASHPRPLPMEVSSMELPPDQASFMKYIDLGAVDVLENPIRRESLPSLAIHVYRVHKQFLQRGEHFTAPTQKHQSSWPGVATPEPFAYMREVMVCDLAGQICGTIVDHPLDPVVMNVSNARKRAVVKGISEWGFSAHELSEDELLFATVTMLEHSLQIDGMDELRLPRDKLINFVATSRNGYNAFVPYHNFKHVVDVLQAVFHLLVRIGTLPPFPRGAQVETEPTTRLVGMLRPFEALTLLIAAIGHDIGHLGVNNMFLVKINSPLARLFNDKSVLESYHAAVYCHMLKRLWPAVVENEEMKGLLISCILSTDMGIHSVYMEKLTFLQKAMENLSDAEPVGEKELKIYRDIACNMLIKCADISNVARPYDCAAVWTDILTTEFQRQADMEDQINLPSTLFSPPAREMIGLAKSQTSFMSFYALPLFRGLEELMPTLDFCALGIDRNFAEWTSKSEKAKQQLALESGRNREGSNDSVDSNNPPVSESSAAGAARGSRRSGGLRGGSGAALGDLSRGSASTHPSDIDGIDAPPPLSRGQPPQYSSRPNSRPVTWDEASASSRPATSSSARRALGMPDAVGGQVMTHRRSETTDGSASVPDSGGWEGSARTADSGKSEEKAECMSTARTSVESSSGMRGLNGVNGAGAKRKSLVGSMSTPDLRSDSKGRMRRVDDAGRRERGQRRKGEKGGDNNGVFASMRELTRRPSLGKFKFWKKRGEVVGGFGGREMQVQPQMPNVMGRRGREGGVSVG
ncbi:3',5'-cyclic-nucleotide phosphodiesterase [Pseudogymnoascus destructans]|uniref:Phosphodiesterase n=2 Tax=Pseudogymnoascus destructans TaxID=655981 RepID=L8FUC9_PSED2|nr:3',5'-cyclic-nucleotide phosphodiesterase [Pseudogymnoascus destructans]ELR03351.1 hypothetical protein GMDG_06098 [Pseudogymnoascus destructans 20631-21]OAF63034.1 3',5'-cyclic-nucleotide phosphodiesterase [Pseudogymnoascus destructans]